MHSPHALVTNDDGIDSGFLRLLVDALSEQFTVSVAAPASEQSWIGRAMSRHKEVSVDERTGYFGPEIKAWAIDGTPSDCINIALGHLLPKKPDIVLSGINIGFNTTDTLILSSGTVAGAIEGALWDLPSIAFSQCIEKDQFAQISDSKGQVSGSLKSSLEQAARHACQMASESLQTPAAPGCVLNVNFPPHVESKTRIEDCTPAEIRLGSLFQPSAPGKYRFQYTDGRFLRESADSDRAVLARGSISRSLLNFSQIGRPLHEWSTQASAPSSER